MIHALVLRDRALAEIETARGDFARAGHGASVVILAVLPQRADPARWPG